MSGGRHGRRPGPGEAVRVPQGEAGGVGQWGVAVRMKDYGVRVYAQGVDFRMDNRRRDLKGEAFVIPLRLQNAAHRRRGLISGLSKSSAKRLEFVAANVGTPLTTLLTLTYRENPVEGESDEARNLRVARRSKADLNRFLTCVRLEIGGYLWVQEFQERGVVHYHVLCERPITEQRARLVWCRAIDSLHDAATLRYAVRVEQVANPQGARSYVGRYMGKQRQKSLPAGVSGAGRWWGRSRDLQLELVTEVVTCQYKAQDGNYTEIWVARQLRRYLTRVFGRKFRGGFFVNWGGRLTDALSRMTRELRQWFMDYSDRETARAKALLERFGFEAVPSGTGEFGEVVREERAGLVDILGADELEFEQTRQRWAEARRDRPRPRRGLWRDYFPTVEGYGSGVAGTGGVSVQGEAPGRVGNEDDSGANLAPERVEQVRIGFGDGAGGDATDSR